MVNADVTSIINKKILIVTAHPDDELLWFYAGIKNLSSDNEIDLLCLTYDQESERGRELLKATKKFKINIHFGRISDSGINRFLSGAEAIIEKYILDSHNTHRSYEIIITHPLHGGEKPHPHHIQAFKACLILSHKHSLRFAFFSEKILEDLIANGLYYEWTSTKKLFFITNYLFNYLRKSSIFSFGKELISIFTSNYIFWGNSLRFKAYSYYPPALEKKLALLNYTSQIEVLEKYEAFNLSEIEYLYLQNE